MRVDANRILGGVAVLLVAWMLVVVVGGGELGGTARVAPDSRGVAETVDDAGVGAVGRDAVRRTGVEEEPAGPGSLAVPPARRPGTDLRLTLLWSDSGERAVGVDGVLTTFLSDGSSHRLAFESDAEGQVAWTTDVAPQCVVVDAAGEIRMLPGPGPDWTVEVVRTVRIGGQVVSSVGSPVPDAEVCIEARSSVRIARADGRGSFSVDGVAVGATLSARHDDFLPSRPYVVRTSRREVRGVRLTLGDGAGGRLVGTVADENGAAVSGARVSVAPLASGTRVDAWGQRSPSVEPQVAVTDPSGAYRLLGVPIGPARLEVVADGYAAHEEQLTVEERTRRDVVLGRGATVTGRVVSIDPAAPDGRPLAGVFLTASSAEHDSWAVSGADGSFRLSGLRPGEVTLRADDPGHHRWRRELSLDGAAREVDVLVDLTAAPTIQGALADERGTPLVGWIVGIGLRPGLWLRSTVTDVAGTFELVVDDPSAAMLLEAQPARSPQVAISQGPRAALTLGGAITVPDDRLPSAWFTGVVLAGGEPVSQASVLVSATGSDTGFPFWSEADGSFALGPLAPGEYEVRVAAGGTTTKPLGVFTAVRGSEVELGDAHLLPAASLVLRIEGRPAEGGSVSIDVVRLEAAGAPTVVFRGNLHGAELRMESLSPGDYLATAWDRGGELASGPFRAEAGELVRISLDLGTAD